MTVLRLLLQYIVSPQTALGGSLSRCPRWEEEVPRSGEVAANGGAVTRFTESSTVTCNSEPKSKVKKQSILFSGFGGEKPF